MIGGIGDVLSRSILKVENGKDPKVSVVRSPLVPCVRSTCARGAGIHGDVLNVHTRRGEGQGGVRQPRVFHRENKCF